MNTSSTTQPADTALPWQLQMYHKSLKKRQKVDLLLKLMGPIKDERCLLISGHDNNGAMNYYFRAAGGTWSWGQVYEDGISEMSEFLGDPVAHTPIDRFPFADNAFDVLIMIDVHEHFSDLKALNSEIARVAWRVEGFVYGKTYIDAWPADQARDRNGVAARAGEIAGAGGRPAQASALRRLHRLDQRTRRRKTRLESEFAYRGQN